MTKIFGQQIEALNQNNGKARIVGQKLELIQTQANPPCHVLGQSMEFTQTMINPACRFMGQSVEFSQTTINPVCRFVGQSLELVELTPSVVQTKGVYMEVLRTPDDVQKRSSPIVVTAS